jgi:hypothetical protein
MLPKIKHNNICNTLISNSRPYTLPKPKYTDTHKTDAAYHTMIDYLDARFASLFCVYAGLVIFLFVTLSYYYIKLCITSPRYTYKKKLIINVTDNKIICSITDMNNKPLITKNIIIIEQFIELKEIYNITSVVITVDNNSKETSIDLVNNITDYFRDIIVEINCNQPQFYVAMLNIVSKSIKNVSVYTGDFYCENGVVIIKNSVDEKLVVSKICEIYSNIHVDCRNSSDAQLIKLLISCNSNTESDTFIKLIYADKKYCTMIERMFLDASPSELDKLVGQFNIECYNNNYFSLESSLVICAKTNGAVKINSSPYYVYHNKAVHIYGYYFGKDFSTFDKMIKYMPEINIVIHINRSYSPKDLRETIKKYLKCEYKKNIYLQINGETILHLDNHILMINCNCLPTTTSILLELLVKESATLLFKLLEKVGYRYSELQPYGEISEIKLVSNDRCRHTDFYNLLKKKYRVSFD